jgi:hypothetical protein
MAEVNDFSAAQIRFLFPYLPEPLLQAFLTGYVEHGDVALAQATMRADSAYDTYFPGNRRPEDGTIRFTEVEYSSYRDYFRATLASVNVNPDLFTDKFARLIEGDVSPAEFAARVDAIYERVVSGSAQIRAWYASGGLGGDQFAPIELTDSALIASALDPEVGEAILNRRISMAEVGGEGALRGFGIDFNLAESLVQAGVGKGQAQELFGQAAAQLPILDVLARRHNDPDDDFDINEFTKAAIFDDPVERQRIRRLIAQEQGLYTQGAFNRGREGEVLGLLAR